MRSPGVYFEGNWGVIGLCTVVLASSSINVSVFHSAWLDTLWTHLIVHTDLYMHVCEYNALSPP